MKKIIYSLFIILLLCGCANNMDRSSTVIDEAIPTVETETIQYEFVDEPNTELDYDSCTYTKKQDEKIKKWLKKGTHIYFIQENKSGIYDETNPYDNVDYKSINTDVVSKVTYLGIPSYAIKCDNLEDINFDKVYASDIRKKIYFVSTEVMDWHKEKNTTMQVAWDLNKYNNCYDLYKDIIDNNKLIIDTKGEVKEGVETYIVEENATKEDIKGIDYDTLGEKYIIYEIEKNKIKSVETKVILYINNLAYYCSSKINIMKVDNEELSLDMLENE